MQLYLIPISPCTFENNKIDYLIKRKNLLWVAVTQPPDDNWSKRIWLTSAEHYSEIFNQKWRCNQTVLFQNFHKQLNFVFVSGDWIFTFLTFVTHCIVLRMLKFVMFYIFICSTVYLYAI